jgi:hypothetical protein
MSDLPAWRIYHSRLEQFLFVDLPSADPSSVADLTESFTSASEFTDPEDLIDARGELVNAIVAAGAAERSDYTNLTAAVSALADTTFSYEVAEACLARFPLQTLLFVLRLLEAKLLTIYPIHNYVSRRISASNPVPAVVLLYFSPELSAAFPIATTAAWRKVSAHTKSLICPEEIPPDIPLDDADFTEFCKLRARGFSPSPLIGVIRADDAEEFLRLTDGEFDQTVPFSIYEQYLHFEYRFERDDDSEIQFASLPTLCDAIALFGSRKCFAEVLEKQPDALSCAAKSLVESAGNGLLELAQEAGVELEETESGRGIALRTADPPASKAAVIASLVGSNPGAFAKFMEEGAVRRFFSPGPDEPALVHWAARGNAITALKLLFGTGTVDLDSRLDSHRSMLHWAANFAAFDVIRLWTVRLGQLDGVNEKDESGLTPLDIAGAVGLVFEKGKRGRLYELLLEATNRGADKRSDEEEEAGDD